MHVDIYIKPGCINHTKQITLLEQRGYTEHVKNIFTTPWPTGLLAKFFKDLPTEKWINTTAPSLKNGEQNLEELLQRAMLLELIEDKSLIRSPLLFADGPYACGFDRALPTKRMEGTDVASVLRCPRETNTCNGYTQK